MEITINDLTVHCCNARILDQVDARIEGPGVTVIVGPSGVGKTTTMRCIQRQEEDLYPEFDVPTGEIRLDGENIRDIPLAELRQQMPFILQTPVAFHGSVLENVMRPLKCLQPQLKSREIQEKSIDALTEVELGEKNINLKVPARALSGGQLQRLSIARGIACNPKAILLDEPTSSLDPMLVQHAANVIRRIAETRLVLLVTHNLLLARWVADTIIVLWPTYDGAHVIESGPADEVLDPSRRDQVGRFVNAAFDWAGNSASEDEKVNEEFVS